MPKLSEAAISGGLAAQAVIAADVEPDVSWARAV
jgi:hypothetical protein